MISRFKYTLPFKKYLNISNTREQLFNVSGDDLFFVNNARTALRILLSSISDSTLRVGVQAYTCHSVFEAIHKAGHEIVFVDISDNFKLDQHDLEQKIQGIDALILTHTFGHPDCFKEIKSIVGDIPIIEDCAHAFLSKYNDVYCGLLGDASVFSTGLGKFPAIGAGGFGIINKREVFPFFEKEFNVIRKPSFSSSIKSYIKTILFSVFTHSFFYGWLTYPLGRIFDSKLDVVGKFNTTEHLGFRWVNRLLLTNLQLFKNEMQNRIDNLDSLNESYNSTCHASDISISNHYIYPTLSLDQDGFMLHLLNQGIEGGKHFSKCLLWAKEYGYEHGMCPNTESIVKKIVTIPTHNTKE